MFGRIGPMELVLILTIALIIFGPSKLPEIGRSIGRAITEFKSQANSIAKDVDISNLDDTGAQAGKQAGKQAGTGSGTSDGGRGDNGGDNDKGNDREAQS